jgi:hypothetical protein
MRCFLTQLLAVIGAVVLATAAAAHDPGLSRGDLRLDERELTLRLAFHASDVRLSLGLDAAYRLDDAATRRGWSQQLLRGVRVTCADGRALADPAWSMPVADQRNGLSATLTGTVPAGCAALDLAQPLLGQLLAGHRQVLQVARNRDAAVDTRLLAAGAPSLRLSLDAAATGSWRAMLYEGVRHILIGYDHLAFLGVLLLAVLLRAQALRAGVAPTARELLVVISAFTLAHSLTLGLAATGLLAVPSHWVEATIAASVVVAGLLNLLRAPRLHGGWLAFGFGLVHGLGFASVFAALTPPGDPVGWLTVAQFNLGVELGQLLVAVPAAVGGLYVMRRLPAAPQLARAASLGVALLGGFWVVERLGLV